MSKTNPGKATFDTLCKAKSDPDAARELLERLRWPNGPVCPREDCNSTDAYQIKGKATSTKPARKGLYKCKECRRQFTVTVGTVFEQTRVPLHKWIHALELMCSSKKGTSAHQLHRTIGVQYKTAWFMCHRIRKAMERDPLLSKLGGKGKIVEVDETYVGGRKKGIGASGPTARGTKAIVLSLVERDGSARSEMISEFNRDTVEDVLKEHVDRDSDVMTDGAKSYLWVDDAFASHGVSEHARGVYSDGDISTNTVESKFSLLKRGVIGTFHHVSKQHLPRYLEEFDFRWNHRKVDDVQRLTACVGAAAGKRLYYRAPKAIREAEPKVEPRGARLRRKVIAARHKLAAELGQIETRPVTNGFAFASVADGLPAKLQRGWIYRHAKSLSRGVKVLRGVRRILDAFR